MLKGHDIICISMTFWDAVWLSNHQYMKRLAVHNRVLFVERPVSLFSYLSPNLKPFVTKQLRYWWRGGIRQAEDNLFVASPPPALPLRFEQPITTINQVVRRTWTRRIARKLGFKDPIVCIYDPDAGQMIGHLGEKLALYFVTDDHPTMGAHANRAISMRQRERELIEACDLVITTTENLRDIKRAYNNDTHYIPHGTDSEHFAQVIESALVPMPELADCLPPVIGFIGNINYGVDAALLTATAAAHPEWTLVLIGPVDNRGVDLVPLEALSNVRFLGRKPKEDLPRYLKSMSVCLIPYVVNEHYRYVHPLKALEYLAAGRPVVSTPLPALKVYQDYISVAGDTHSFIAAIEQNLVADTPTRQRERVAFARQNNWENRLEEISALAEKKLSETSHRVTESG